MNNLRALKRLRRNAEFSLLLGFLALLLATNPVVIGLAALTTMYSLYAVLKANKMVHLLEQKYK
jgi:hypothetical protein